MIGEFRKDKFSGDFIGGWTTALKSHGFEKVCVCVSVCVSEYVVAV